MRDKIAIYSRKSRYTGKGESIENQIELCIKYIEDKYHINNKEKILIFEDEGYSGKTLDRPQFEKMMECIKKGEIYAVACYRLDRISRNISDFAKLIEEFNNIDVAFISIKEQFDTSSPMGRAMMYIASVFSQLERETTAERIKDNMQELAKTGRWLGGNTPTGYSSCEVENITADGKSRRTYKLMIIPDESDVILKIYKLYLKYQSLSRVVQELNDSGVRTKNNKEYSRFSVRSILTNPVYMIGDRYAYGYFADKGMKIFTPEKKFNGKKGVMAYNKTLQNKGKRPLVRDINDWVITLGEHSGIISGADWVNVQNILNSNKSKSYKNPRSSVALLSGLIVCGGCGSYMRPKTIGSLTETGRKKYIYVCKNKERTKKKSCSIKNLDGVYADKTVIKYIDEIELDENTILQGLDAIMENLKKNNKNEDKLKKLMDIKKLKHSEIKNLTKKLGNSDHGDMDKYIFARISELNEELTSVDKNINLFDCKGERILTEKDYNDTLCLLRYFDRLFVAFTIEERRAVIKNMIDSIVWDGMDLKIHIS